MKMTEKLDVLMKKRRVTRGDLARGTGIPYTTITSFYDRGYENMKLTNLRKIAEFFGVGIELLVNDEVGLDELTTESEYAEFVSRFSRLSRRGQRLVDGVLDTLLDSVSDYEREPDDEEEEPQLIREFVTPAAAGYASPAEGEDYVLVPRTASVPAAADFAVRIDGDSMEPYIEDGSRVYVTRTPELTDGDVGIFFVDGDMKCKQYCEDAFGNIYLMSLNRARADADVTVPASGNVTVFCFGKVLLKKRPPLPRS